MTYARQGDILIQKIDQLPKGLKTKTDNVLVYGESTGHSHRLVGGKAYLDKEGALFLAVASKAQIVHDEHHPIKLGKGFYSVIRQREYTSGDMTRLVID